jgi:hypothetical protein
VNNAKRSLYQAERKAWPAKGYTVKVQENEARPMAGGGADFAGYRDRNALCRGRARDVNTENFRRSAGCNGVYLT